MSRFWGFSGGGDDRPRTWDLGLGGFGFRPLGVGVWDSGLEFRVWGLGICD